MRIRGHSGQAFHKWIPFITGGLPDQCKYITTTEPVSADSNPGSARDTKYTSVKDVYFIALENDEKNYICYITIWPIFSVSD